MKNEDQSKFSSSVYFYNCQKNQTSMSPASTPIGDLNSPAAQSKTHSPQHRHSPSASDKQGAVTITLHTLKDDFDEKVTLIIPT